MRIAKRILLLTLSLVMMITILAACGSSEEETTAPAGTTTKESAEPATITVFIAASLKNVMTKLQTMYNEEHPEVTIVFNADSSGTLQTQIQEGAACDIFFSAASKQMETLNAEGFIINESIVHLLENKLVLISGIDTETEVTGFEDVIKAADIAMGAAGVPVGDYAEIVFTSLGMIEQVHEMEINRGANVTAILTAVSEGSNEVGIVYATDAQSMKDKVRIIAQAPEGSMEPAVYPAALVENSEADAAQSQAASDFLKFLQSDDAGVVFKEFGFSTVK